MTPIPPITQELTKYQTKTKPTNHKIKTIRITIKPHGPLSINIYPEYQHQQKWYPIQIFTIKKNSINGIYLHNYGKILKIKKLIKDWLKEWMKENNIHWWEKPTEEEKPWDQEPAPTAKETSKNTSQLATKTKNAPTKNPQLDSQNSDNNLPTP